MKTLWLNIGAIDRDIDLSGRKQILTFLSKLGVEIRTTFNYISDPQITIGDQVNIKLFHLKGGIHKISLMMAQQKYLYANRDVDVVILRAWKVHESFPLFLFLKKILKKDRPKFILDIRTLPVDLNHGMRQLNKKRFDSAVKIALKYFDGITVITDEMKRYIESRFNTYGKTIGVWSTGVDTELFNPKSVPDLREQFDIVDRFVVMYHGIFSPNRGLQATIRAIDIVRRRYPDILLFLLGKGPAEQEFRALVKDFNLEHNVFIHSVVPFKEVPAFINMADIAILPFPSTEGWNTSAPLKLAEYMAMAKPCLVSDIPAHRNVFGNNPLGWYINKSNTETIAEALITAIREKEKLASIGLEAREFALKNLSWERQARILKSYLESLLK